jgi:hypothetical protein
MNTIKFSIFFFLLTISLPGFTQERVNRPKLKFDSSSDTLTKATGWAYNETLGEWIDFENSISDNKNSKQNYKVCDLFYQNQNFSKLYTKSILHKGLKYYIFIIEKCASSTADFKKFDGYIFTDEEYQKLRNLENLVELRTCGKVSQILKSNSIDETLFLDLIQSELLKEEKDFTLKDIFPVMKSNEGMIRFYLPDFFWGDNNYNFDKAYFEVDPKSFSKIILK